MAVVGWIVTMFAEMFGVELAAAVEASTEKEDKKAEKTSLKEEAIKEVRKDVEIKVDEREKPKVPVSLFDVSPGFVRPVPLSKPELDLLPGSIKIPTDLSYKQVINNEDSKVQKPKANEEKKAEQSREEVCPQKVPEQPGKKAPVIFGKTGLSGKRNQCEKLQNLNNGTIGKEMPTVGSTDKQKGSNTGKETIDIDKIYGKFLAEQNQISPESELNSINVQPKGTRILD
ncbi:hypothetical protein [Wolbachia endosymbiont (group A) of Icerya purchasi]|uniref:hypothetical protein n=1 Tax=Wolbachia endosymbiont (group A) of Icerya purchasi TaxID=2954019 RepID=UPI0022302C3A|nr:hypothetical protein [Wolbachia endosymbiont (group A) of Icerya purchasi]